MQRLKTPPATTIPPAKQNQIKPHQSANNEDSALPEASRPLPSPCSPVPPLLLQRPLTMAKTTDTSGAGWARAKHHNTTAFEGQPSNVRPPSSSAHLTTVHTTRRHRRCHRHYRRRTTRLARQTRTHVAPPPLTVQPSRNYFNVNHLAAQPSQCQPYQRQPSRCQPSKCPPAQCESSQCEPPQCDSISMVDQRQPCQYCQPSCRSTISMSTISPLTISTSTISPFHHLKRAANIPRNIHRTVSAPPRAPPARPPRAPRPRWSSEEARPRRFFSRESLRRRDGYEASRGTKQGTIGVRPLL